MKTETFEIVQLFELTFIDGSKLWASINCINGICKNDTICFGTFGKGLNIAIKELLNKDKDKVCFIAYEFSKNKNLVSDYIDYVELESLRLLNQLAKAS